MGSDALRGILGGELPGRSASDPEGDPSGFVYWMVQDRYVKIGYAVNVVNRLRQYQTGSPYPVEFAATLAVADCELAENRLHRAYREHWERGEWFRLAGVVADDFDILMESDHPGVARRVVVLPAPPFTRSVPERRETLLPELRSQMSERQWADAEMYWVQRMSVGKIAQVTGQPQPSVLSRIKRAKALIRAAVARDENPALP